MQSHIHDNEYVVDRTIQPASLYEEQIITINREEEEEEEQSEMNNITNTSWETSPIRRVQLISGPHSAFARLFPDKYRQQEQFDERHRCKSTENQRTTIINRHTTSDDEENDYIEGIRKSRRVRFYTDEDNGLHSRAKSEPYLHLSSEYSNQNLNYDPNPEVVYQDNPDDLIYTQKVGVRYLRPPTPPPPGPIVIREIQSTPPLDSPPFVVSTTPPIPPRTPSPLIVREQPPPPPEYQPAKVITKTLPPPPVAPRRVIIKRLPPLPAKPRPVIIEKWLPYQQTTQRPVLYERTEQKRHPRPVPRNLILQYEPARVQIKQEIQNFGCFRVDPHAYQAQHGPSLRRTDSIRRVLEKIGCNADFITSTGYNTCYFSTLNPHNTSFSHYDYPRQTTNCFTDQQLDALIGSSYPPTEHHYDVPRIYDDDDDYDDVTNLITTV